MRGASQGLWTLWVAALLTVACTEPMPEPVKDDADADTDADSDADADSDMDADSDTDADADADTGDTAPSIPGPDFALRFEGSPGCEGHWDVATTLSSYSCPSCPFTLEWSVHTSYTFDPSRSDVQGCQATYTDSLIYIAAANGTYYEQVLASDMPYWSLTLDHPAYGAAVVTGTAADPNPRQHTVYDPATGDFEWVELMFVRGYGTSP